MAFINKKAIKELARKNGRIAGKEFIEHLNMFVERKVAQACEVKDGGKKTLTSDVANYVGIRLFG